MSASDAIDGVLEGLADEDPYDALRQLAQGVDRFRRVALSGTPESVEALLARPARLDELPPEWRVLVCGVVAHYARTWGRPAPTWTHVDALPRLWSPTGAQPGTGAWERALARPVPGLMQLGVILCIDTFETA